jgi:hypothetical protein
VVEAERLGVDSVLGKIARPGPRHRHSVRARHAELIGRCLRGIRIRRAHGIELGFGHALQRRHMRTRPPSAACSDEAHA